MSQRGVVGLQGHVVSWDGCEWSEGHAGHRQVIGCSWGGDKRGMRAGEALGGDPGGGEALPL